MWRRYADYDWRNSQWAPYVPMSERRRRAAQEVARLAKKGRVVSPVRIDGREIAKTFWGKAWCQNLEAYSDFANRLPRGLRYARNGSVVDLQVAPGKVTALVQGSSLYEVEIGVRPVNRGRWEAMVRECAGGIDSLVELLQGHLSEGVMKVMTRPGQGLFPTPREIAMRCSCPDWANLCKHVAAALYGVGARLDEKPELLFLLRGVDPHELLSRAGVEPALEKAAPAKGRRLKADLGEVFGIEIDAPTEARPEPQARRRKAQPGERKREKAKGSRTRRGGAAPKARSTKRGPTRKVPGAAQGGKRPSGAAAGDRKRSRTARRSPGKSGGSKTPLTSPTRTTR
jgi:uncharacterized Zn finger protein